MSAPAPDIEPALPEPVLAEPVFSQPVFSEPWEAQIFALVVGLREAGVITASDWAGALGAAIRPADAPEQAADFAHWLAALEGLLTARGLLDASALAARAAAFERAAAATPHGHPIRLENDPLAGH